MAPDIPLKSGYCEPAPGGALGGAMGSDIIGSSHDRSPS
jgi:hypothetical protein